MQDEWREPGKNRLQRYDIAGWLRFLVEIYAIREDSVTEIAQGIRARMKRDGAPWSYGDEHGTGDTVGADS